jgi:hypothetical protein
VDRRQFVKSLGSAGLAGIPAAALSKPVLESKGFIGDKALVADIRMINGNALVRIDIEADLDGGKWFVLDSLRFKRPGIKELYTSLNGKFRAKINVEKGTLNSCDWNFYVIDKKEWERLGNK